MRIIGFGYQSRVGKDSAAKFLQTILTHQGLRCKIVSFAAPLKETTHKLYAWAGVKDAQWYEDHEWDRATVIPALGMTVVDLWIKVGMMFRVLCEDTWVECFCLDYKDVDVLIIKDVRFWNECVKVHAIDGLLVNVKRPGFNGRDSAADHALDDYEGWDYELVANDLRELNTAVEIMAEGFFHG